MWTVTSLRNEAIALRAECLRGASSPQLLLDRELAGWSLGGKPQSNRPMRLPRQGRILEGRIGCAPRLIDA